MGEEIESLFHMSNAAIPKSWILPDKCSTVNVFSNQSLLHNIRWTPIKMVIKSQAGTTTTNVIDDLTSYPEPVWYVHGGIANLLSLSRVKSITG